MKQCIGVFLLMTFVIAGYGQQGKNRVLTKKRPNIIYIYADDLGYGDVGCYGQAKIETPHIDQLAKNGIRFTQHYAFPVCAPSRYLLMTGIHSGKAYIRGNHDWGERGPVWDFKAMEENPYLEGQWPIPDSTLTIAEVLKDAGYTTGLVGKWGLGAPYTTGFPTRQGFDYFYGYICQRQDHTYYNGHLWENELRIPLDNKVVAPNVTFPDSLDKMDERNYRSYQQNVYAPDLLIKAAIQFIEKNKSKPFFLYYPSPLPHVSLQAPEKWVDYYHKKLGDEQPYLGGSYFPCRYPRATYAAMIATLDEQVGQLIEALKKNGLYDNTIVMFCSDNGPSFPEMGVDAEFFNSAGPFSSAAGRTKGFVYEGGIREPFIVQWPGVVKPGTESDMVAATIDIMPTLCDLLKLPVPANVDGLSILPTLLGKKEQQKQHAYLYFEYPEYGGQQAVRMGNWKAVRTNILKGQIKTQLFNLDTDIQEQNDVASQHPDIVKKIDAIMEKEHHTPEVSRFLMPALEKGRKKQ
ncbi:N-acetylgalactosamine-6-sulfatase [Niabella ginsenosidivorans]|uniref:N-acetylgalactosamine-6-sulfatase n=1 Tax=Niabella ginsenosidivorans TaxID=1176587 RepID=A0A1A9HZZ8_9BACT|nr:arylsulfatase [Niabella ginsenosidivorans]ANH80002.1 N-acetylgalactosamine-6-sulfatase [Niabella ginsenosidivorans]